MIKIYEGHTEDGYLGGQKWVGDKSHQHLYGSDLSSAIRQDLKDNGINGCSVRNSKGRVTVTVKATNADKISFEDFEDSNWQRYADPWVKVDGNYLKLWDYLNNCTAEQYDEYLRNLYDNWVVNRNDFSNCNGRGSSECLFTKAFCDKLQKIDGIIAEFNYDDSNAMVDYFNTNFYYSIDVVIK